MRGHLMGCRADYSYSVEEGVVCIVDHDNGKSVTNDADNVIDDLVKAGIDVSGMPVIYRDTEGYWDQLLVSESRFVDFASIHERERIAAIRKVKARPGAEC